MSPSSPARTGVVRATPTANNNTTVAATRFIRETLCSLTHTFFKTTDRP
jgi:hypothetical protein